MAINNLFILGSGFTKAVFPDAPVNDELLIKLIGLKPDKSPLGLVWDQYGMDNIETLLTKFDLDLIHGKSNFTLEHREKVSAQIASYFIRFRFNEDVPWLKPFLEILLDNDIVVSLNYDCFLEGYLDFHGAWSPRDGYHVIKNMLDDHLPKNDRNIRILKIHGSENFRLSSYADKPQSKTLSFEIDPDLFPRSGKGSYIGGGVSSWPYVIAPSFAKMFGVDIQYLLLDSIRFAKIAKNLVIIGCGLRAEDSHIWQVLTSFMHNRSWEKKRTIIVSPNASELRERISDYWGVSIFNDRNLIAINSGLEPAMIELKDHLQDTSGK